MSYTVIDKKSESHTYGVWPVKETVTTTMKLVHMGQGELGLIYDSVFSGIKKGHVTGGPIPVKGDQDTIVNNDPKVEVIISHFSNVDHHASMNVKINVTIKGFGTHMIYNQTLGGDYDIERQGWQETLQSVEKHLREQQEAAR